MEMRLGHSSDVTLYQWHKNCLGRMKMTMLRTLTSRFALTFCCLTAVGVGMQGCAAEADEGPSEDDLVASFDRLGNIDLSRPTRILLVGDSDKLGDLPLHSATGRARRYTELYPNEQIVLFITKDVKDANVTKTGATIVRTNPFGEAVALSDLSRLSTEKLMAALDRFKKISSIDFFGHSSPFGALLEAEGDDRVLGASTSSAKVLADNFVRDGASYVTLNGCNGGVETAAALSKLWSLPVSGALTGSNFQELKSDDNFYVNDPGFFPAELSRATSNNLSFSGGAAKCAGTGACMRMKPQDAPYWGVWSNQALGMQYGLGFYKFFCNYTDTNKSCVKGMAASLYGFISEKALTKDSSDADVKLVLADFLCSRAKDATWFDRCKEGLENAVATGTPFSTMKTRNDYALECDFKGCEQEFRCTKVNGVPQKKTCTWVAAGCPVGAAPNSAKCFVKNTKKQTARNEYNAYLEGHALLRSGGGGGGGPAPVTTCFSSTLARDVGANTCVQSRRNGAAWFRCENTRWVPSDGTTNCTTKFPL